MKQFEIWVLEWRYPDSGDEWEPMDFHRSRKSAETLMADEQRISGLEFRVVRYLRDENNT